MIVAPAPAPQEGVFLAYFDGLCEPSALSETDKAWMAGFVDGEGCISINKQVRKTRISPAYRSYVGLSSTDPTVLTHFVAAYGGRIYALHERRHDQRGLKWADAFDWVCPVSSSERLLVDVLPYLRIKAPQATIVLEFLHMKQEQRAPRPHGRHGGSGSLTQQEIIRREAFLVRVQALNRKGRAARLALAEGGTL